MIGARGKSGGSGLASAIRVRCIHPTSDVRLLLEDGRSIELVERIGHGNYGAVFRGNLESAWGLHRPVAIKVFALDSDTEHPDAMRELGKVCRRAACVREPSFVQVFELAEQRFGDDRRPVVVSELVEGESLASLLRGWRASDLRVATDFALVVLLRVAEALGAALFTEAPDGSLTNLVHGDISPRQILLSSQGEVKLGDFGHSLLPGHGSSIPWRERIAYLAPEVANGTPPSARSDVFALGVLLHELLVGERFAAELAPSQILQLVTEGRVPARLFAPNLPRSLVEVIERAVHPMPSVRYAHARAMAFDLRREMLRLGLSDTRTCVRHAIVGGYEDDPARGEPLRPLQSDIVPRFSEVSVEDAPGWAAPSPTERDDDADRGRPAADERRPKTSRRAKAG